jgi:hypothetical protein
MVSMKELYTGVQISTSLTKFPRIFPPPSKRGRREDDDDKSRRQKKLEKGKDQAKDADEEPLFDDTKFTVEMLRSAFRKLEGVGEA